MMAIARIYTPQTTEGSEEGDYRNFLWDYILDNYQGWKDIKVKLLYMTQQAEEEETSLIVDIQDTNAFGDFVTKYIAPIKHVKGIWLFDLINPTFFPIPEGTPRDIQRFMVTITADPQEYANIYKTISEYQPTENVVVTYIAFIFQSYGKDILISIVAKDYDSLEEFSNTFIKSINGVQDVSVMDISKTQKLVSREEWREYLKPFSSCAKARSKKKKDDDKKIIPWEYNEKFVCC
jgi:hypothetical protein